jgi:ribonuclease P protein component
MRKLVKTGMLVESEDLTFPGDINHIRKKKHFQYVFGNCKKINNSYVSIYYAEPLEGNPKFAIVASRKVGKAVERNKCRRRLWEFIRLSRLTFSNHDMIFVIKRSLKDASFQEMKRSITELLSRYQLIQ